MWLHLLVDEEVGCLAQDELTELVGAMSSAVNSGTSRDEQWESEVEVLERSLALLVVLGVKVLRADAVDQSLSEFDLVVHFI